MISNNPSKKSNHFDSVTSTPNKKHNKKKLKSFFSQGVEMPLRNIRRTHETYDPKQRFVGGVVLVLLILFIYSVLKLVLGLSAPQQGNFKLNAPIALEEYSEDETLKDNQEDQKGLLFEATELPANNSSDFVVGLPAKFVFLDLNGDAMGEKEEISTSIEQIYALGENELKKWYVQAASFKDQSKAQVLVRQIKERHIAQEAYIVLTQGWYVVRLPPQTQRRQATQQNRQLDTLLKTKGIIKELSR